MDDVVRRRRFGRALKVARKSVDMNQTAFAEHLSSDDHPISQSLVSRWELGQVEPEPEQVFVVEHALGAEPGSLSRYLGYVPVDPAEAPEPADGLDLVLPRLRFSEDTIKALEGVTLFSAEQHKALQEALQPTVDAMKRQFAEAMQPLLEQLSAAAVNPALSAALKQLASQRDLLEDAASAPAIGLAAAARRAQRAKEQASDE